MQLRPHKKRIVFSVIAITLAVATYIASRSMNQGPARIPFVPAAWNQAPPNDWYPRHLMLADFIEHHALIGIPKSEVISLLGQPQHETPNEIEYGLRIEYGHGIEPSLIQYFVVQFDSNNFVISHRVKTEPTTAA